MYSEGGQCFLQHVVAVLKTNVKSRKAQKNANSFAAASQRHFSKARMRQICEVREKSWVLQKYADKDARLAQWFFNRFAKMSYLRFSKCEHAFTKLSMKKTARKTTSPPSTLKTTIAMRF